MTSPWRTMSEAADYLRLRSADNARRFLLQEIARMERRGETPFKLKKRGHSILVHIDDLEGTLRDVTPDARLA